METSKTGYQVQSYDVPVKRYCQTLDLRNSPELIAEYRKRHSQAEAWPEILAGIREVGILEMEIYILGYGNGTPEHPSPPTRVGRIYGYLPTSRTRNEFRREMETDGKNVPFV